MPGTVTLLIKSVHQGVPDEKFEFDSSATISQLKEKLYKDHVDHPAVSDQRLIYFGQLLNDSLSLQSALRHPPDNNLYTIHIAYPKPLSQTTKTESDCIVTSTMDSDGVRRRNNNGNDGVAMLGQMYNPNTFMSQMPASNVGTDPIEQIAALQQMYSQYMTSYMQYVQRGYGQVAEPPTVNPSEEVPPEDIVEPQNVQPVQGNQPEADEEGAPRDWLDYIYWFIQIGILVTIIHFHSTMMRCMIVILTSLIVYLYQSGFFNMQLRRRERPEQPAPMEVPIGAPGENPAQNADRTDDPPSPANPAPQNVDRSLLSLSMTFLTTFFTSLIPDNNPPIAV